MQHQLDSRAGLQQYVHLSFAQNHPEKFEAMNDGRISNPVVLEITPQVIGWKETQFADRNANTNSNRVGGDLDNLKTVHFQIVKANAQSELSEGERPFFQAEVLVKNHIPLDCITNIGNFSIALPDRPNVRQIKAPYTAQITRNTPTAFIFMVDRSGSMGSMTTLGGESMTMAEAAARIVNN